jgi:chemotaxis protein methyltransferase WspC
VIDDRFEALLKHVIGLDAASIGTQAVERAVLERCALWHGDSACDLDAYWTALNASAEELQMLIDAVVVPETWFFRDREAFAALAGLASERLAGRFHLPLRLLSLPCSTGEEPYSMAMALFDVGIAAGRFVIDAVDVSDRAVSHAARAVYGRNSFRGHQDGFRERYFAQSDGGWQLEPAVRDAVRFRRANLFDAALFNAEPYDFVFCRNVLIYFDRATQDRAAGVLDRLLAPDGALFVGPSETGLLSRHGMTPVKIPLAFAFRRAAPMAVPPAPVVAPARILSPAPVVQQVSPREKARLDSAAPFSRTRETPPRPREQPFATPAPVKATSADALAHASCVADQGRLVEAAALTTEHVRVHGPSAAAFYLLGLIADASGHASDAGGWYQKTLYLEPTHQQALTHLGALLELRGDYAGARLLSERVKRANAAGGVRGG